MKYSVQQLLECVLATRDLRAKHEDPSVGLPTDCLVDLLDTVYSEWRESFLQPLKWKYRSTDGGPFLEVNEHEDVAEQMGTYPEQLLLRNLFVLFLDHLDEGVVRELFAEFGPKPPRLLSTQRQKFLFDLYIGAGLPPKMRFVREVVNYNKTVPPDQRLGSRSTSEVSMLKYVERMLDDHRERVEFYAQGHAQNPLARRIRPITEVRAEMPITKTGRQFPRKMSRQT